MGVPKGKTSKANRRMNRASRYTSEAPALAVCPKCHALKQPHHVCMSCGYYNDKAVLVKKWSND